MFFNGVNPLNVTAQPFFETALGGPNSAFCKGFASCSAAVASNYGSLIKETAVSDLWNKMDSQSSWILAAHHLRPGIQRRRRPGHLDQPDHQPRLG